MPASRLISGAVVDAGQWRGTLKFGEEIVRPKWEAMSDEDAIEHGKDATTSVAYCGLEAKLNGDSPESRFWFDLFMKLQKQNHVGWA